MRQEVNWAVQSTFTEQPSMLVPSTDYLLYRRAKTFQERQAPNSAGVMASFGQNSLCLTKRSLENLHYRPTYS